jgi:hypothetical protein
MYVVDSKLGQSFWPYALMYSVFIKNRIPHSSLDGEIPFQLLFNKTYDYKLIKRFGSSVIYLRDDENLNKFDAKGSEGIFLGFPMDHNSFFIYSIEKKKVLVRKHVKFLDEEKPNVFEPVAQDYNIVRDILSKPLVEDELIYSNSDNDYLHEQISENDLNQSAESIDYDPAQILQQHLNDNHSNRDTIITPTATADTHSLTDLNTTHTTTDTQPSTLDSQATPQKGDTFDLTKSQFKQFTNRFPDCKLQFVQPINTGKRKCKARYTVNSICLPRNATQAKNSKQSNE